MNFNLKMQKRFKEDFVKILKDYRDLQRSAPKVNRDNLNNFRSNLEFSKDFIESFVNAFKRKIKFKNFNKNLNED